MTAAEIADKADCSEESARTHLSFYVDLGIVIHHEGRPARYERNDDYFQWRRVNELALNNSVDELQTRVSELTDQIEPRTCNANSVRAGCRLGRSPGS